MVANYVSCCYRSTSNRLLHGLCHSERSLDFGHVEIPNGILIRQWGPPYLFLANRKYSSVDILISIYHILPMMFGVTLIILLCEPCVNLEDDGYTIQPACRSTDTCHDAQKERVWFIFSHQLANCVGWTGPGRHHSVIRVSSKILSPPLGLRTRRAGSTRPSAARAPAATAHFHQAECLPLLSVQ